MVAAESSRRGIARGCREGCLLRRSVAWLLAAPHGTVHSNTVAGCWALGYRFRCICKHCRSGLAGSHRIGRLQGGPQRSAACRVRLLSSQALSLRWEHTCGKTPPECRRSSPDAAVHSRKPWSDNEATTGRTASCRSDDWRLSSPHCNSKTCRHRHTGLLNSVGSKWHSGIGGSSQARDASALAP